MKIILSKFSSSVIIRVAAMLSVALGLLYLPSRLSLPIIGLGPELEEGKKLAELWAMYAVCGGLVCFFASFLLNVPRSILIKRVFLAAVLAGMFLLIAAQLPPLFWWMFVGGAVFSWSSVLGFCLHLIMLSVALWGAISIIHAIEHAKRV